MELVQGEQIVVNYHLVLLLFFAIPLARLLRQITTPVSTWAVQALTRCPEEAEPLKTDVSELRKQMQRVSMTEEFPKYARLKRALSGKEKQLNDAERGYWSRVFKRKAALETVLFCLIEFVTIALVIYYRSEPVLVLPTNYLWPVESILQFPTGVPGAIGPPVWALCIRQTLDLLLFNLPRKRH